MVVLRLRDGSEWSVISDSLLDVRDLLDKRAWVIAAGPIHDDTQHAGYVRTAEVVALWEA